MLAMTPGGRRGLSRPTRTSAGVKAIVGVNAGAEPGPSLERVSIAHCREHLADVKCLRSVDFRPSLPRHPTGKGVQAAPEGRVLGGHDSGSSAGPFKKASSAGTTSGGPMARRDG